MVFPPCFQAGRVTPALWGFLPWAVAPQSVSGFIWSGCWVASPVWQEKCSQLSFGLIVFASWSHLMAVINVTKLRVHPLVFIIYIVEIFS